MVCQEINCETKNGESRCTFIQRHSTRGENFYSVSSVLLGRFGCGSSGGSTGPETAAVVVNAAAELALPWAWSMVLTAIDVGLTSHNVVVLHKISSERSKTTSDNVLSS